MSAKDIYMHCRWIHHQTRPIHPTIPPPPSLTGSFLWQTQKYTHTRKASYKDNGQNVDRGVFLAPIINMHSCPPLNRKHIQTPEIWKASHPAVTVFTNALMKTPSNPQFSPFRPIKCRLIQSFSILKCVLGVPDHTGTLQKTWFLKKPSMLLHFCPPPPPPPLWP